MTLVRVWSATYGRPGRCPCHGIAAGTIILAGAAVAGKLGDRYGHLPGMRRARWG